MPRVILVNVKELNWVAFSKPIFFLTGQQHREELPKYLESKGLFARRHIKPLPNVAGIKVDTVIAYSSQEKEDMKEKLRLNLCVSHSHS